MLIKEADPSGNAGSVMTENAGWRLGDDIEVVIKRSRRSVCSELPSDTP